jgi:hypothetical protein
MRWLVLVIFFIVLSTFSFASPINVEFEKNYYRGETVQGKLFIGEDVEDNLRTNDFRLELDGVPSNIYPTLIEFDDYIYFFFNLPVNLVGNCSFVIEDLIYHKDNILTEEDIFFNFTILETNESIVNVNPALVSLDLMESNYFYLDVSNPIEVLANVKIVVEDNFITPNKEEFLLGSGEGENIEFYVSSVLANKEETSIFVEYGNFSYIIPLFLENVNLQPENNATNETVEGKLIILEERIDIEIDYDESDEGFIRISNEFEESIESVSVELTGNLEGIIELEFYEVDLLDVGEVKKNRIYVNELGAVEEGEYTGEINVLYNGEIQDSISIHINVLGIDGPGNVTPPNPPDNPDEGDSRWTTILFVGLFFVIVGGFVLIKYIKSKKKEVNSSPWSR